MDKSKCLHCEKDDNKLDSKYCSNCGYELPKTTNNNLSNNEKIKQPKKTNKRKQRLGILIGAMSFLLAYAVAQKIFFNKPSYDKVMVEAASELNKLCPVMVDAGTRLDNTMAFPNNIFQYNYTLVNIEKETADIEEIRKIMEPKLTNLVKTTPDMKGFRDNNVKVKYTYKDKNGQHLLDILITSDKYK